MISIFIIIHMILDWGDGDVGTMNAVETDDNVKCTKRASSTILCMIFNAVTLSLLILLFAVVPLETSLHPGIRPQRVYHQQFAIYFYCHIAIDVEMESEHRTDATDDDVYYYF